MIDKLAHLNIVHQSAELYLEQCSTQFGHLLIDLYNAQSFPPECNNEHFFLQCKHRLKTNGFLAVNLANSKEQHAILELIKTHFKNTLVIPIKKCANMVIIASNHGNKEDFINMLLGTKEIKKIVLVSAWGYVADIKS
jgi:spermidine synthase